jgi:hypothetical protein
MQQQSVVLQTTVLHRIHLILIRVIVLHQKKVVCITDSRYPLKFSVPFLRRMESKLMVCVFVATLCTVTRDLQKLFKDTQWTVTQMCFVTGHKSVSASIWHDLLLKFSIRKEDRVRVIKNLGRTLLDELENLFRSYWGHMLGVSDGLLQVLDHSVRVKTQEILGHHLQGPEHHIGVPVY